MKLHLPCALRGALLACFAIVCTVPAWADNDVTTEGTTSTVNGIADTPFFIKTTTDAEYTIKTSSPTGSAMLSTLNVINDEGASGTTKIIFDGATITSDPATANASFVIANLAVEDGKELHIVIKAGTTVTLSNVNFTSKVTYEIEAGGRLMISADDCAQKYGNHVPVITGSGSLVLFGGTIDASKSPSASMTDIDYDSGLGSGGFKSDMNTWLAPYLGEGADIKYEQVPGYPFYVNGPNGGGGKIYLDEQSSPCIDWKTNGAQKIVQDTASVIIDPDTQVYRSGTAGNKVWNLHPCGATGDSYVSVQQLQSGKLGDVNDAAYVAMAASDGLSFQGATLTSSESVIIGGSITVTDDNAVKLEPAEGTIMTFLQGDGALSNPNGLILSGGKDSVVYLMGVTTAAPENITFTTENTVLALSGEGQDITLDATKNIFLDSSMLGMIDGGTLIYKAKESDTIGALFNLSGNVALSNLSNPSSLSNYLTGTVEIGKKTDLSVTIIAADTLNITKDGTKVTANTILVRDLNIADMVNYGNELTVNNLTASGKVDIGSHAKLDATNMEAKDVKVGEGGLLTGESIQVTDSVTLLTGKWSSGSLAIGNISAEAQKNMTATMTGVNFTANQLTASSMTNGLVTVTASQGAAPVIELGTANNTAINAAAGTTLANTQLNSSTVSGTDALTLSGVSYDTSSTVAVTGTDATITLNNVSIQNATMDSDGIITVLGMGQITVGSTTYKLSSNVLSVSKMQGSMSESGLAITSLTADVTHLVDPTSISATIITGGDVDPNAVTFTRAPGMGVSYDAATGLYKVEDISDQIVNDIATRGGKNLMAMQPVLIDLCQKKLDNNAGKKTRNGGTNGQIGGVLQELYDFSISESFASLENRQAALEALASGSINMLSDSQRRGVTNTINTLRNRVVQMGNPQGYEPETYVHGWIEADGSYNDIEQDGGCAGYEFQTWGGTVGVNADRGNLSFGAAISAAYGDLTAHSLDRAEGDHDTQTLSLFARHQKGSWTQLGILSIARNELSMTRTISAVWDDGDKDDYKAESDASGHTITAYYEVGYTYSLTEDYSQVIQPHVSIMLTSARMGNFSESGSIGNAGLIGDTEDYFYGTVGIGARYQAVLGTNVEGRLCFAEARAKIVADFGDDTNERTVSFKADPSQTFRQYGAEVGKVGFQFGAGISVPVGVYTTLFADVDADIRSGATAIGGGVGMRVEF